MFTTFGTSSSVRKARMMRDVSSAIARCACSVEAPTCGVPYTSPFSSSEETKGAVDLSGSSGNTSSPTRSPFFGMSSSSAT